MATLAQTLFRSAEVRVLSNAYREEVRLAQKLDSSLFGASSGISIINDEILDDIVSNPATVKKAITEDSRSPRVLALLLMAKIASRHASCGQYHTYRGTLSMSGLGLRSLVSYSLTRLVALKNLTEDERKTWLNSLDSDIKEAG